VDFDVKFPKLNVPIDQYAREIGFLGDFSQWAFGKNFDGVSLEVRSQSSGGCDYGEG
jgi:hypothetical protein